MHNRPSGAARAPRRKGGGSLKGQLETDVLARPGRSRRGAPDRSAARPAQSRPLDYRAPSTTSAPSRQETALPRAVVFSAPSLAPPCRPGLSSRLSPALIFLISTGLSSGLPSRLSSGPPSGLTFFGLSCPLSSAPAFGLPSRTCSCPASVPSSGQSRTRPGFSRTAAGGAPAPLASRHGGLPAPRPAPARRSR
jgi:hypothetical protein